MKAQNPEDRIFVGAVTFNKDISSTTFGGDTLAETMAAAFNTAMYHMAYHDDVKIGPIFNVCRYCNGKGEVHTRLMFKYKKCPTCKGKNSSIVVCDRFATVLSRNVKIVPKEE